MSNYIVYDLYTVYNLNMFGRGAAVPATDDFRAPLQL